MDSKEPEKKPEIKKLEVKKPGEIANPLPEETLNEVVGGGPGIVRTGRGTSY